MSLFSGIFENVAAANNSIFSDPALFTRGAETPIPCSVEVDFEVEMQPDGYEASGVERVTTLEAMISEVGNLKPEDIFDVSAGPGVGSWVVRKILENNGQFIRVIVNAN